MGAVTFTTNTFTSHLPANILYDDISRVGRRIVIFNRFVFYLFLGVGCRLPLFLV